MRLEFRKHGERFIAFIRHELVSQLGWRRGDTLDAQAVDGCLKIVRIETAHARAMKIARKGMERYRGVFEKLAKT